MSQYPCFCKDSSVIKPSHHPLEPHCQILLNINSIISWLYPIISSIYHRRIKQVQYGGFLWIWILVQSSTGSTSVYHVYGSMYLYIGYLLKVFRVNFRFLRPNHCFISFLLEQDLTSPHEVFPNDQQLLPTLRCRFCQWFLTDLWLTSWLG